MVMKVVDATHATALELEATSLATETALEATLDEAASEVELAEVELLVDAEVPRADAACLVPSRATAVKLENPWATIT
jgi:hypothetical protein